MASAQSIVSAVALHDERLPWLAAALDPALAGPLLTRALGESIGARDVRLLSARLARHKPGRRCLIAYDLLIDRAPPLTVIAKMRAKGTDRRTHDLHRALRDASFADDSASGVSVTEPLGVIPELGLWLQRRVPGVVATDRLVQPGGDLLARRIATAIHRLHDSGVTLRRSHTIDDELRILRERLVRVADQQPPIRGRVLDVLDRCEALGRALPPVDPQPIHRDFYADQVLVAGDRLYLLDLDLLCLGDPALDVGNFVGHITEHALRSTGDPAALARLEAALIDRYVALHGAQIRPSIAVYTLLTLARHISISTQIPARRRTTVALLDLCERRLR